jgi:hypothetical protein
MSIEHIMNVRRTQVYYKQGVIHDTVNNLRAIITYNPNFNAGVSGIGYRYTLGWLPGMNTLGTCKNQQRPARADDLEIEFKDASGEVKVKGHGNWLSYLILDEKLFWRIEDELPKWNSFGVLSNGDKVLESDTRNRLDVLPIIAEEWEEAE